MNNLTDTLLTKNAQYIIEETAKEVVPTQFRSGAEQRIAKNSIPSMSIDITYSGLTKEQFISLRDAYENNFANTFICEFDFDKRPQFMTTNASVWVISSFEFRTTPNAPISGTIKLFTSVFFNFEAYQNLHTELSSYTPSTTTDPSFEDVLFYANPYEVSYKYENNSLYSNIAKSAHHGKDNNSFKRKYDLTWLLNETNFNKLLTFYRKKSGSMGEFGMPDFNIFDTDLMNARFENNSLKYTKRLDGLYSAQATILEVRT